MKVSPVGDELLEVGRWTDGHDEINRLFRNFAEAPKKKNTVKRT